MVITYTNNIGPGEATASIKAGGVEVTASFLIYPVGDVNGDIELTNKDRLQLSRYLANRERYGMSTI